MSPESTVWLGGIVTKLGAEDCPANVTVESLLLTPSGLSSFATLTLYFLLFTSAEVGLFILNDDEFWLGILTYPVPKVKLLVTTSTPLTAIALFDIVKEVESI